MLIGGAKPQQVAFKEELRKLEELQNLCDGMGGVVGRAGADKQLSDELRILKQDKAESNCKRRLLFTSSGGKRERERERKRERACPASAVCALPPNGGVCVVRL